MWYEDYGTAPTYPPFNPDVPVINLPDERKQMYGQWHMNNVKRQSKYNSKLYRGYQEAKKRGFTDEQALEYVTDVATSLGWSRAKEEADARERVNQKLDEYRDSVLHRPTVIPSKKGPLNRAYDAVTDYVIDPFIGTFTDKDHMVRRTAAGLSGIGSGFMLTNCPPLIAAGAAMQVPDMMYTAYDLYDGIRNRSAKDITSNGVDMLFDVSKPIVKLTPWKIDDYLNAAFGINDLIGAGGNSGVGHVVEAVSTLNKQRKDKQEPNPITLDYSQVPYVKQESIEQYNPLLTLFNNK